MMPHNLANATLVTNADDGRLRNGNDPVVANKFSAFGKFLIQCAVATLMHNVQKMN